MRFFNVIFLICQPFVARCEVDDATIGEAVLFDVVLHDRVVHVGVDTDVCIMRKTEVHDVVENAVNIRITGNAMDDVIGFCVIQSFTIVSQVCLS